MTRERKVTMMMLEPAAVHKIAVLRANALGDFVFVLPAVRALRETFPEAEIVYLGKTWHQTFIPGRATDIDRVVVVPQYPGVGEANEYAVDQAEVEAFFAHMQAEQFD